MLNEIMDFIKQDDDIRDIYHKTRILFVEHTLNLEYLRENFKFFKPSLEEYFKENKVSCHNFLAGSKENWCFKQFCNDCVFRYRSIKEVAKGVALFNNKEGSTEVIAEIFSIVASKATTRLSNEVIQEIKKLSRLEENKRLAEEISFTEKVICPSTDVYSFSESESFNISQLGRIYSAVYILNYYSKARRLYLIEIVIEIIEKNRLTNELYNFLVEESN